MIGVMEGLKGQGDRHHRWGYRRAAAGVLEAPLPPPPPSSARAEDGRLAGSRQPVSQSSVDRVAMKRRQWDAAAHAAAATAATETDDASSQ